jgi:hypothetical protein
MDVGGRALPGGLSSATLMTLFPGSGPSCSRSARTTRSARARSLTSKGGSCVPLTSVSSSTPCSLIGSVGSWSRTRRLAEAAAVARGPRRWRRLKGKISTAASVLACLPLPSLLTRIWIQIFCSTFNFD